MKYLAETTKDPETDKEIRRFWLHLRGEPTEAKKHLLNAILCIFSQWYRKAKYRDRNVEEMGEREIAEVSNAVPLQTYHILLQTLFN